MAPLAVVYIPDIHIGFYWGFGLAFSALLYFLAERLGHGRPWLALIPLANIWLVLDLGGVPWWFMLTPLIPFVGYTFLLVGIAIAGMSIAERRGKQQMSGVLLAIPPLNLLFLGWLAFGD